MSEINLSEFQPTLSTTYTYLLENFRNFHNLLHCGIDRHCVSFHVSFNFKPTRYGAEFRNRANNVEDFTSFVMRSFSFKGFDVIPLPSWANERAFKAFKFIRSFYFSLIIVNFILIFISLAGYAVINFEDRSLLYTALPNLSSAPFIFFKISMVVAHRKKIAEVLLALKEIFPVTTPTRFDKFATTTGTCPDVLQNLCILDCFLLLLDGSLHHQKLLPKRR